MHEARNGCTDELCDLGILFLNDDRKLEMQSGLHSRSLILRLLHMTEKICGGEDLHDRLHIVLHDRPHIVQGLIDTPG